MVSLHIITMIDPALQIAMWLEIHILHTADTGQEIFLHLPLNLILRLGRKGQQKIIYSVVMNCCLPLRCAQKTEHFERHDMSQFS